MINREYIFNILNSGTAEDDRHIAELFCCPYTEERRCANASGADKEKAYENCVQCRIRWLNEEHQMPF